MHKTILPIIAFAGLHLGALLCLAAPSDSTADAVIGQVSFELNSPNQPDGLPSAANLALTNAAHLAIAPSGRLYASDPGNNRILSWPAAASFTNGAAADMVFGQPDFESNGANNGGVSAASLNLPQGLCVDEFGDLWVADAFNSRVLKYDDPESDATPLEADLVIGQFNFTTNQQNLGNGDHGTDVALPDGLQFPGRVVVRWPNVWIADSGNSRVLHYTAPVANKPFADRVLGQFGDFTRRAKNNDGAGNNGCCASAENLFNPIGIALDAGGHLFVADWMNHRVLRYDEPLTSDLIADAVIGQPDLVSRTFDNGGPSTGLQFPIDLDLDLSSNLLCADSGNNRILVYINPLSNNVPDKVLGQLGSFASDTENHGLGFFTTDADGLSGPTGVAVDAQANVYVSDTNNMRVLRFDTPIAVAGDLNCDDILDVADASAFALALVDEIEFEATYRDCAHSRADINHDAAVDGRDIAGFVELLLGL